MIRLLVADDSALMRRLLARVFGAEPDFELAFASNGVEALALLHRFQPDVVTLDVRMPLMDGLATLDRIMLERPCPVVMLSAPTERGAEETLEAMRAGAVDFIAKPGGAISLSIDALAPRLVDTVRAAARVRISRARRLRERVRLNTGRAAPPPDRAGRLAGPEAASPPPPPLSGPPHGVVLVGCSTGGPPALDVLLGALPSGFPWPVLVAQHMPAAFTGPLARRLGRLCALEVAEVLQPTPLLPGRVLVARGDADLIVARRRDGAVAMPAPSLPEHRWHPSVDRLVLSALQQLGAPRLVGVLMTGMGSDGAAAMARLAAEGGRTIAEAEDTAVVWGMPGELVRAGGAQIVAPLDQIPARLLALLP